MKAYTYRIDSTLLTFTDLQFGFMFIFMLRLSFCVVFFSVCVYVCLSVNVSSKHFCLGVNQTARFQDTVLCRHRFQALVQGCLLSHSQIQQFAERTHRTQRTHLKLCIQSYSYYRPRRWMKEEGRGRDTEGSTCESSIVFPKEPVCITLSALMCGNMHGVLPTREIYSGFNVQRFCVPVMID